MGYLSAWAAALNPTPNNPLAQASEAAQWGQVLRGAAPGAPTLPFDPSSFLRPFLPNTGAIAPGSIGGAIAPGNQALSAAAPPTPLPSMLLAGHVTTMRGTGYWFIPTYVSPVSGMSAQGVVTTQFAPLASNKQLIQYLYPAGG